MKKKMVILLLTLGILGMAAGCGDKKADTDKKEETAEEFVLTNDDGKVVAVDVENLEDYITLGEYKNLTVEESPKTEISDEDVDSSIHYMLLNQYEQVEVTEDRAVQKEDTVNIDYTGYMDGEEFEGGSATGDDLLIGSGSFISGFEDGLIGHKKGEEVTLDLNFPEDYQNEEMQGKAVQFKVKINKISQAPELTDEWVAANTDYKTVEEYKAAQKELMQKSADADYESQVKSDLFSLVVDDTEFKDYPEDLLKDTKEKVREQLDSMYQAQVGISLDDYIKQQGISEEDEDKALTEQAQNYLKQNLVVQGILKAEGIEMTEKDYEEEVEKFAQLSGFPDAKTMQSYYSDQSVIKESVLWNRACDVLMETATVNVKEAETGDE